MRGGRDAVDEFKERRSQPDRADEWGLHRSTDLLILTSGNRDANLEKFVNY